MSTPDTSGREPRTIFELVQPRCLREYGVFEPASGGIVKNDGDAIASGDLDRTSSISAFAEVTFATPTPTGTIWEQGGAADGVYLGITSGELSWVVAGSAIRTSVAPLAGETLTVFASISFETDTIQLRVYKGGSLLFGDKVSVTLGATWAGTDGGGIGDDFGAGIVAGEDGGNFNGTITSVTFYENEGGERLSCKATGTPKCYNTYSTCTSRQDYDGDGFITWRLTDDSVYFDDLGVFDDPNNIRTNGIPCVTGASTASLKINPGANRDGESPFGVTEKLTISAHDIEWDDHVGDPYLTDRSWYVANQPLEVRGGFWRLFNARNSFLNNMLIRRYDGYVGQTLNQFRRRDYFLENIDGPAFDGSVKITGVDPLKVINDDKTQYPPASDLDLVDPINSTTTSIQVFGDNTALDQALGNDGRNLIVAGDEVFSYTGYVDDGSRFYTLTGVQRGVFGTAQDHAAGDKLQRAAYFDGIQPWVLLEELLTFGTRIPSSYIPSADWNTECLRYIPSATFTRLLLEPRGVRSLAGEICQQALFYVWWAAYERQVKLLTIRPPDSPVNTLTDENAILDGIQLRADHEERITRVVVYYDKIDQFGGADEDNFRRKYTVIDADTENAGISPVIKTIFAEWINTRAQATNVAVRLLLRYRETPRFVKLRIDAKDREISIGDIADIQSAYILDTEGNVDAARYQIISAEELEPGHTYMLDMQTYDYVGRFGYYEGAGTPNYLAASPAQREFGGWYAGPDGLMSNGDGGYKYQ